MRALLAATLLLLTTGCLSAPLETSPAHDAVAAVEPENADGVAASPPAPDAPLMADSQTSSAFRIWRGHDAAYELFANEEPVKLNVALAPSAYALFALDGPAACDDTDLGTGVAAAGPVATTMTIDCGILPLGWYRVHLSVAGGLARGTLSSAGGHLRALEAAG